MEYTINMQVYVIIYNVLTSFLSESDVLVMGPYPAEVLAFVETV